MDKSRHAGGLEELLSLIHASRETLIEAFNNNGVHKSNENSGNITKLLQARALINTRSGYLVNPKLMAFIHYYLETESTRYLDTEYANRIPDIRELAESYLEAKRSLTQRNKRTESNIFNELQGLVYTLITDLIDAKSRLHSRVEQQFGYATSLEEKATENNRALEQATNLVKALKEFSPAVLADIAGGDQRLGELLCLELPQNISDCQADLEITIGKLRLHLMAFRERQKDKRLIQAFDGFFNDEHTFALDISETFHDIELESSISAEHHLVEPIAVTAFANFHDINIEDDLDRIATNVLTTSIEIQVDRPKAELAPPQNLNETIEDTTDTGDPIDSFCDDILTSCISEQREILASDYYIEHIKGGVSDISRDAWLFGLLGYHEDLLEEQAAFILCTPIGDHYYPNNTGNIHIVDISVRPR
ncbi:hypothetical protein A6E01_19890 (plasmid) [Vibrio breoganii]|uniref:Phosphoenolpyruvate carboxylase n=3 Tax=Vibrio TaxID=662 RepID=A0AAN0XZP9_9VIBR|nr:hypothetical protein [Vibrio breoganii]ANO35477.1 hypothetical protein A6E01_19890 [Vibrio breoganii]PML13919.1 hypothetical protein BCT84_12225 [Vibrio breoganii]